MDILTYDYVIVGSGSAGSVLANRLTEDGNHTVLVLEYGGSDIGPLIQMPAALSYPMNMKQYDWGYKAEPEESLNGRSLVTPRGKVIGGSSSINGMIYVRGHAGDFDHWEINGAKGWGYADVLPYFKRAENAPHGDPDYRGHDGPLHISRGPRDNPLHEAFADATKEAGYRVAQDYNGKSQEGFGPADMTVHNGRRWSTANAYLKPALKRDKLSLLTHAMAERILFEGKKATGIEFTYKGRTRQAMVRREVILAAGAINSPLLLQKSGIGDADELKLQGMEVRHDLKGVGKNLQDHLEVYFQIKSLKPVTLYKHLNLFSKAMIGAQWLFFKKGLGASNQFETLGFIRSDKTALYPDIQYHFLPVAIRYDGKAPAEGHGFQLHVGPMRSKSRGYLKYKRNSAGALHPEIKFNYMSHPDDWVEFRRCIRISRDIMRQPALSAYYGGEIQPGGDKISDEAIDGFIAEHAESAYHPCGTCKMGASSDPMSVVDPECRVIGMENLRVVDSSLFPRITNGNLNAPTIMTGEKAADMILGKPALPRENFEPSFYRG